MSMSTEGGLAASQVAHGRHDLIGSDRVEGTNVYRTDGKKIGEIERVMIDKFSGKRRVRRDGLWRLPRRGRRSLPDPVAAADL